MSRPRLDFGHFMEFEKHSCKGYKMIRYSLQKRPSTTKAKTAIVLAAILVVFHVSNTTAAESPNILLILTDDQGWSQRSGLMDPDHPHSGSSYLHTPAMDRIANEGMRFTSGYSPALPSVRPHGEAYFAGRVPLGRVQNFSVSGSRQIT